MGYLAYLRHADDLIRQASLVTSYPFDEDTYPLANLGTAKVSEPSRILNRASNKLHLAFNRAVSADFAAVVAHNLSETATITFRGGSSYDPDGSAFSQTVTWRRRTAFSVFSSTQSYQYWSLEITDEANEYGFFQIGRLLLGVLTRLDFSFAENWMKRDLVRALGRQTATGTPLVRSLNDVQTLELGFQLRTETNIAALRNLYLAVMGDEEPLFVIPDVSGNDGFFGRSQREFAHQYPASKSGTGETEHRVSVNCRFQEDPPGRAVVDALPIFRAGEPLPAGATLARNSVAYYKNSALQLVEAAANEWRNKSFWDYGRFGFLNEMQRTNSWTYSEDLTQGVYNKINGSISANAVDEPIASPSGTADKFIEASDVAEFHRPERNLDSCTDNTVQSVSFFLKAGERTLVRVYGFGKASTVAVGSFNLDLSTGITSSPTTWVEKTDFLIERYYDGWWRVCLRYDVLSGGETPKIIIFLRNDAGLRQYDGDGTSGIYLWGFQHEVDKGAPSSYIATTDSAVTRSADDLSIPWDFDGQPFTSYMSAIEVGGKFIISTLWQIADDGTNVNPRQMLIDYVTDYQCMLIDDEGDQSASERAFVSIGNDYELRALCYPDSAAQLGLSDNGGAESVGSKGGTANLDITDIGNSLQVAASNDLNYGSILLCRKLAFHRGVQSLDFMRQL